MLVDPAVVVAGGETLWIAVVVLGAMFSTKAIATAAFSAVEGYGRKAAGVLFGLSVGQAAAALPSRCSGSTRARSPPRSSTPSS
jgi:hypothetical protein